MLEGRRLTAMQRTDVPRTPCCGSCCRCACDCDCDTLPALYQGNGGSLASRRRQETNQSAAGASLEAFDSGPILLGGGDLWGKPAT